MIKSKEIRFVVSFFINISLVCAVFLITGMDKIFLESSLNLTLVMGIILLIGNIFFGLLDDTLAKVSLKTKKALQSINYIITIVAWITAMISGIYSYQKGLNLKTYQLAFSLFWSLEYPLMLFLNNLGKREIIKRENRAFLGLIAFFGALVLTLLILYLGYLMKALKVFVYLPLILGVGFFIFTIIIMFKKRKIEVGD